MSIHQTINGSLKKKALFVSAFAFTALCSTAAVIYANADFSGEWKLNEKKSELGQYGRMASLSMKVSGTAEALTVEKAGTSPQGDAVTSTEKWTFDGKESESTVYGNSKKKSTAKWSDDGKTLNVNSLLMLDLNGQTMEVKITESWTLSDDGKTLTNASTSSSSYGDNTMKLVYEKVTK